MFGPHGGRNPDFGFGPPKWSGPCRASSFICCELHMKKFLWKSEKIFGTNPPSSTIHNPLPSAMYHPASVRDIKKNQGSKKADYHPKKYNQKTSSRRGYKTKRDSLVTQQVITRGSRHGRYKNYGGQKRTITISKMKSKNFFLGEEVKEKET